jgi:hypothetical protein
MKKLRAPGNEHRRVHALPTRDQDAPVRRKRSLAELYSEATLSASPLTAL